MAIVKATPLKTNRQDHSTLEIHGAVAPGFEAVREAFEGNFTKFNEQGAATAIYVEGQKVVDLWGGIADDLTGRPWTEDTLSLVWSATKGPAAMCAHLLVQRGELDFDTPIAHYWPEFAQNGKAEIPVKMILNYQLGLPYVDKDLALNDLLGGIAVAEALAAQAPVWRPGSTHGYHGITYGYLLGELVRRVSGRTLGRYFAEEIAAPLGLDFYIGLPSEHEPRVTRIIEVTPGDPTALDTMPEGEMREMGIAFAKAMLDPASLTSRALHLGGFQNSYFNTPPFHAAELPFGNGIGDARSLARLYAACLSEVDGFRLLSEETIDQATQEQGFRPDAVLFYPTRWSNGFMLPHERLQWLGPTSFGFTGAGGHLGFGDREYKVGFAYTMTKMFGNLTGDPRPASVIEALKKCLG